MELKITQKTFDAAPISALLREGEKAADTLVFVAPKQYGGLILGALQWVVVGNYADYDDFAQQPLQVAETDGNVTLTWVPDNTFTAHPGGMRLWLEGQDNGTTVIKITASQRIAIAPAARKANAAFYEGADAVLQQIAAAAVTAQTNANTAVQAAETANNRATDAEAAKQAAAQSAAAADKRATDAENAAKAAATATAAAGAAAASERAAAKSAEQANAAANRIKDSMAQISENTEAVSQLKGDLSAEQAAREQSDASLQQEISNKLPKSPAEWGPWTSEEQIVAIDALGAASSGWKKTQVIDITEDVKELNISIDNPTSVNEIAIIVDGVGTGVGSKYKIAATHNLGHEFIHWNDRTITMTGKYTTYVYLKRIGNYWKSESINPKTPDVYCSSPTTKIIPYTKSQPTSYTNVDVVTLADYNLATGSKVYVLTR